MALISIVNNGMIFIDNLIEINPKKIFIIGKNRKQKMDCGFNFKL